MSATSTNANATSTVRRGEALAPTPMSNAPASPRSAARLGRRSAACDQLIARTYGRPARPALCGGLRRLGPQAPARRSRTRTQ